MRGPERAAAISTWATDPTETLKAIPIDVRLGFGYSVGQWGPPEIQFGLLWLVAYVDSMIVVTRKSFKQKLGIHKRSLGREGVSVIL